MPKPDAGLRWASMKVLKGGRWTAEQTVCVIVCACVSTGSHGVQQEEGRAGLVTERTDVPSMRRPGNCVGNPQCLLLNLDWKCLSLQFVQKSHNPNCFSNCQVLETQPRSHAANV